MEPREGPALATGLLVLCVSTDYVTASASTVKLG
jgi:hypothetical protein